MGVFDSLIWTCPKCDKENEEQTKMFGGSMQCFTVDNIPTSFAESLDGEQVKCCHCDSVYKFRLKMKPYLILE